MFKIVKREELAGGTVIENVIEIGRASCRERV